VRINGAVVRLLLLAVGLGPGCSDIPPDDLGIDAEKGTADLLREVEVCLPIAGVEIVVEDAADAAHFAAMRQIEIFVAPGLEAGVVG